MDKIDGVILTPLKIIKGASGDVMHALKNSDPAFTTFGEAYFSTVEKNAVKGWKKHRQMRLNLIVPAGEILFVLYDGRDQSASRGIIQQVTLSLNHYDRLMVPPGVWMAFKGMGSETNMLLNIASIPHDPGEADNLPIDTEQIPYTFS